MNIRVATKVLKATDRYVVSWGEEGRWYRTSTERRAVRIVGRRERRLWRAGRPWGCVCYEIDESGGVAAARKAR